jgi:hypothetical protein
VSEWEHQVNYFNSTFKIREDAKPLRSKTAMRRGGIKRSLRPTLKKAGKKAQLRERINRPNRIRFAEMGLLNVCEAKLPGCWPNGRLTWAHGKKDRLLTMRERKVLVIRACTVCHHQMDEEMSHEEMLAFVENVIANRKRIEATNGRNE